MTVVISRRWRNPVLVVFITAVLAVQGGGVGEATTAGRSTGSLSSCPASASWAWGAFLWQPPWALATPATITMRDGGAQPVGIVTPWTSEGVFTGSTDLSWSPDGTALVYRQTTQRAPFENDLTEMVVADWDGSSPLGLQGSRMVWSPTSDRVASWSDDGALSTIGRRTPTGWTVEPGPSLVTDVAWSSDGLVLAWSDTSGHVHVGDSDGHHARVVGSAATPDSPIIFRPNSHLLRIAGPEWFDTDLDATAGAAPRGTLSPAGDWSAWPADADWGGLLISHNGALPQVVALGDSFVNSPLRWSPDGRYLVTDAYEQVGTDLRRAPLLFDTTTTTAVIVGPWHQWDASGAVHLFFWPATFDWSADSSSFFAAERVLSQAADQDGQMRLFRYDVDGTRALVHDWQYNVGATFWPRTTPVAHLSSAAELSAVGSDGNTSLHVTVTNDGPCDAEDVVVSLTTPTASGAADASIGRDVRTLDLGRVPRGAHVERVIDISPSIDLPVTIAISTSTADQGRNAGPLTLTLADVPAPPPSTKPSTSTAPPLPARAAVALPVVASPNFTG